MPTALQENHTNIRNVFSWVATCASLIGALVLVRTIVCTGDLQLAALLIALSGLVNVIIEVPLFSEWLVSKIPEQFSEIPRLKWIISVIIWGFFGYFVFWTLLVEFNKTCSGFGSYLMSYFT